MTAPDAKAVEAAIAKLHDAGLDREPYTAIRVLVEAARAYLRAPTAPQGAEIAREREFVERCAKVGLGIDTNPTRLWQQTTKAERDGAMAEYGWWCAYVQEADDRMRAAARAALTPTDAETKG